MENDSRKMKIKLDEGAFKPERAHEEDAGYDIKTPVDFVLREMTPNACGMAVIDTGVHVEIPRGYVGILKSKSGLNVNHNITGTGVIDCGYTGAIKVKLYNHGCQPHKFKRGDKIIQLVIYPIITPELEEVDELGESERGAQGFGSTGR